MKNKLFKVLVIAFFIFGIIPHMAKADETTYSVNVTALNNNRRLSYVEVMISQNDETITYGTTNRNGIVTFNLPNGTYSAIIGYTSGNYSYYGIKEFTVDGEETNVTVNVDSEFSKTAAKEIYDKTSYFNHVDIRVNGTFTTGTEGNTITDKITLKNVELLVVNDTQTLIDTSFNDNSETYEWRVTNKRIPKTSKVSLIFDILVDGKTVRENFTYSFEGEEAFIQAIINCDMNQGLDFIIDPTEITKAIYYNVSYQWSGLPSNLATPPAATSGYISGETHIIDTQWKKDVYIIDETKRIMYTFSGWTTWSNNEDLHTQKNNVTDSTLTITNDTIIYGVWTSESLTPTSNHLVITKTFNGNNEKIPTNLYFKVTDPNGYVVKIPYSSFTNGEYKLPIYEAGIYLVEELNYSIPGYSYKTDITATTKTVTTDLTTEVIAAFTNTYEKKVGNDIHNYPSFFIEKADSKDYGALSGAIFTLTPTDKTKTPLVSLKTNESGYTYFRNVEAGTYILTETTAPNGYYTDDTEYIVTVTLTKKTEDVYDETQDAYISIYDYVLSITPTEHYNANALRLTVFNEKIPTGSITISKDFGENSDYNKNNYPNEEGIKVVVTGESNYKSTVTLNKANNWTVTLDNLVLGKYVIKELIEDAKLENYNLEVKYNNNEVTLSKSNLEANIIVTNTYTKKTGSLTVTKNVEYKLDNKLTEMPTNSKYKNEKYNFIVTIGNNIHKITLTAGETKTFENIPYGTSYSVVEVISKDSVWSHTAPENATGNISDTKTNIEMINTYNFETLEISVEKKWINKSNTKNPESIEVTLYKDGEVYDTKKLSDNNNWNYIWGNLTTEHIWSVDEVKVPNGYTKEISKEGNTYIITNTYHGVPQTSDSSMINMYIMITIFSIAGLVMTIINYKKIFIQK